MINTYKNMAKSKKFALLIGLVCLSVLAFYAINPNIANAQTRCSGGNCYYITCNTNAECGTNQFTGSQQCDGNNVYQDYITYTCNHPGTADSYCSKLTVSKHQQSCASGQTCRYGSCVENAKGGVINSNVNYLKCVGNAVYWFDKYGNQSQLYQTCASNQTCPNNACVAATVTSHTLKGCVGNTVYWYNSLGTQQDIYQNCSLSGQTCQNGACIGGQSYYTPPAYIKPASTTPAPTTVTTTSVVKSNTLSVSILARNESTSTEWSKEISASKNEKINFLVTVKNISDATAENVSFKIDTAQNINAENIKIDNSEATGNIYSGINLGSMDKGTSKIISFNGVINSQDEKNGIKVTVTANSGDASDSDLIALNISKSSIATASLIDSPFMSFVKQWYLWVIGIIVLISLFVIIFRRLSSNNA